MSRKSTTYILILSLFLILFLISLIYPLIISKASVNFLYFSSMVGFILALILNSILIIKIRSEQFLLKNNIGLLIYSISLLLGIIITIPIFILTTGSYDPLPPEMVALSLTTFQIISLVPGGIGLIMDRTQGKKKKWIGIIGIAIFLLIILSFIIF
jgi:hypothetical protein